MSQPVCWRVLSQAVLVGLATLASSAVLVAASELSSSVVERPWREILTPNGLVLLFQEFWSVIGPGGKLHPAYFLEHKGHLVIEGVLVAAIMYLVFQRTYKVHTKEAEPLTDKVRGTHTMGSAR
jgi:serine palmitoyltransferase